MKNTNILRGIGACLFSAVLFLGLVGVPRLHAQATGSITGTITDMSGAAIAGATVQITNEGTGIAQTVNTDGAGRYTVPQLGIGDYDVQASKTGFGTALRKGITLTVGAQPAVDIQLAVGTQAQTVTVEGAVTQVETQTTAVGALVENKQVTELPLNGRNFTQLLVLAPGVTQIPTGAPGSGNTFYGNGVKYSIAGSRPSGQAYLLDDQDMVNFWNNGPGAGGLGTALGVEAIAEFQALTNTYSPQFGGQGAVINASSKSGTNAYHGSAFEFLRNNKLEARNFFDNVVAPGATSAVAPTFRQNQYGGSLGGPIKKDKAFFFVNYEGLRRTQIVTNVVNVPDACVHNQVVAGAPSLSGCAIQATLATNPAAAAAVRNIMALYPLPNYQSEIGNGVGTATVADPTIGRENYILGRVDYTLSDKDTIFARYALDFANRDFVSGIPYWPEYDRTRDHFASVEWRRIISSRLVNSVHVSYSRTYEDAYVYGSPTVSNGVPSPGSIGVPTAGALAGPSPVASGLSSGIHPLQFFNLTDPTSLQYAHSTAGQGVLREDGSVSPGSGVTGISASATLPFYLVPNKYQFGDDVIWTSGAHSITAGASMTRLIEGTWAPFIVAPQWSFANLSQFIAGSAVTLNGQVSDVQNPQADATKDYRYNVFGFYVNDQWKVSNKLTVNAGVRYSPTSIISTVGHEQFNLLNAPAGNWVSTHQSTAVNPSLRNIDPRIGLAYDPFADHKTSIRASFGVFHSVLYSRDTNHWLQPPFLTVAQNGVSTLNGSPAPIQFPTPWTNVAAHTGTFIPTDGSLSCTNCDAYGRTTTPYQMQWNLTIEREIMANTVFSIGYVGSHNVHLPAQRDFNFPIPVTGPTGLPTFGTLGRDATGALAVLANPRINPAFGPLSMMDALADSHYHALQTSLNRRFSQNWQMQVSYTFSKSIDDGSGAYGLDGGGGIANPISARSDTGLSNFNRTHNFRLSGIYDLPLKVSNGALNQLVGGWQLTGIYTYLSGAPFSIGSIPNRLDNSTAYNAARPNAVANCSLYTNVTPEQAVSTSWFNASCFAPAPLGVFGNAGRDTIIGPNLWDMDASLSKNWRVTKISEAFTVQFRAEAFNILNHPSFQNPSGSAFNPNLNAYNAADPTSGVAKNGGVGLISAVNSSPRQVQLALKIIF